MSATNHPPVTYIDPSMARRMLARNTRNRPVAPRVVEKYRRDMENGRWIYAADPIRFASDGTLLDGQHRLLALASLGDEQGISLPFLVIRGLPLESQMVMDQGRKRSASQQLALKGMQNSSMVAAGVKLHLIRTGGLLFRSGNLAALEVSTPAIEAWVADNHATIEGLHSIRSSIMGGWAPPSVAYAAAIAFWEVDPTLCVEFFRLLRVGAGEGNAINSLDKRLQNDRKSGVRPSQRDLLGMFFQAWNLWREGRRSVLLKRPTGGYKLATFPKLVSA